VVTRQLQVERRTNVQTAVPRNQPKGVRHNPGPAMSDDDERSPPTSTTYSGIIAVVSHAHAEQNVVVNTAGGYPAVFYRSRFRAKH